MSARFCGLPIRRHTTKRIATLAVVLVLVAAACGGTETTDAVEDPTAPADDTEDSSPELEADDESSSDAITVAGGRTVQQLGVGAKPVLALDADAGPAVAWLSEAIDEGFVSFASRG